MRCSCHILGDTISIHAPRTGSDVLATNLSHLEFISIHAPRTGSDGRSSSSTMSPLVFQSTLPARGATEADDFQVPYFEHFNPRSPHGERPSEELELI